MHPLLLNFAALLATDERVHQKVAESRDFGEAMQKLFIEPSKPDETDRWNAITSPNPYRPFEGYTRMLGLPQPPTGFKALDMPDRLKRAEHQLGNEITNGVKKLFTGTSDEMQSADTEASLSLDHASSETFDQLTGSPDQLTNFKSTDPLTNFKSTDPLTNFDAAAFESDDSDHDVGFGSFIGKTIGKQVGKEVAKQAAKEIVKNNVKQATRELVKQSVKEGIKEAAKESVKSPLKYLAREAFKVVGGYFGIKEASKLFNGMDADISESESVSAGRVSGFTFNSEPQDIEALNLATGSSFNLNSGTDQSANELLVPGLAISELNPKNDASQPLLA